MWNALPLRLPEPAKEERIVLVVLVDLISDCFARTFGEMRT
jgi:hypothetical protein